TTTGLLDDHGHGIRGRLHGITLLGRRRSRWFTSFVGRHGQVTKSHPFDSRHKEDKGERAEQEQD
ncbi:MAG: hypothetical protein LC797_23310, partial [Chloroflexi bacterium]|nr:hypothetical protein [Chloroflexota bacterium]